MLYDSPKVSGAWAPDIKGTFWNRTGATLTRGHIAMCDFLGTQSETTSFVNLSEGASQFDNLTPCTQAQIESGIPVVVALADIADNARGLCQMYGKCQVAVLDDDVSTTDIDKGDPVQCLVSESAVAIQAGIAGNRRLGIALEDAAASSSDTDRTIDANMHLRYVLWTGGVPCLGTSNDVT